MKGREDITELVVRCRSVEDERYPKLPEAASFPSIVSEGWYGQVRKFGVPFEARRVNSKVLESKHLAKR